MLGASFYHPPGTCVGNEFGKAVGEQELDQHYFSHWDPKYLIQCWTQISRSRRCPRGCPSVPGIRA
eukprot:scaffold90574_cov28-Attheya_sp.AAC.1